MKKMFLTLALVVSMVGTLSAQVDGKAIGLRFGGLYGSGAEISYQHPLGDANRLEVDLGLNYHGLGLNGIYQWVWDLSALSEGFKWYAGVGGGIGTYRTSSLSTGLGVNILGQIGIEYNFNIPLQLSLDYRPGYYVLPTLGGSYDGVCLSARYRF
jgi:hypothetical protein